MPARDARGRFVSGSGGGGGGSSAGTASVEVVPDASGFGSKLAADIQKGIGGVGGALANIGKVAVAGIALGTAAVGIFAKQSIDAARESIKVSAQTEAVIKSTGGAAGVTSQQVGDYAHQLQNLSGVSDENIQSGANMLLTFTNIRNGVGKNNDIFNQSTATALDMSVALGTDVPQAALQLGKALNDPIKGMTSLQRVGVTFTQEQKDQVAAMVASGDVAGAQKVILAELNKEFGGSAKAAGDALDPMQRLGIAWGDMQEQVGMFLIPVLGKLTEFLVAKILPAARNVIGYVGMLAGAFKAAFSGEGITSNGVVGFFERLGVAARGVVDWFQKSAMPVLRQFGDFLKANLQPILVGLGVALGAATVAFAALAIAEIAAAAVPLLIVAGIAALVAAVVYAYSHVEAFRVVVQALATFFTQVLIPAVSAVASYIITQLGNAVAWVQTVWPQISEAIGHVMVAVQTVISTVIDVVIGLWHMFGDDILTLVQGAFNAVRQVIENVLQVIRGVIQLVLALINGDWGKAWEAIKQIVTGVLGAALGVIQFFMNNIRAVIGAALQVVQSLWSAGWNALTSAVSGAFRFIVGAVSNGIGDVVGFVRDLPGKILGALGDLGSLLFNAGRKIIEGLINGIKSAAGGIADAVKSAIPGPLRRFVPGFASGVHNFGGGFAMVGERGPELTYLPKGSSVYTAPTSSEILRAMANNGGSSAPQTSEIHNTFYIPGAGDPEAVADAVISKLNTQARLA
jgi:phage-related protein